MLQKKVILKSGEVKYVSLTYNDLLDREYTILDFKLKQHEKQHVVGSPDELQIYETKL